MVQRMAWPIREALHAAVRFNRLARETGNRELQANTYKFIKENYHRRNVPNLLIMNI